MSEALLKAEGLVKRYGKRTVVNGVDMEVKEGEVVAVIGPNGAGKSTTLDMLLGLKQPEEGSIAYWRKDYRGQVGVQLQDTPFFPGLTVMGNLKLFAAFYRQPLSREAGLELLRLAGLQEVERVEASRLSGGQQKRLAIVLAMVHEPKLLFLDEPTAALDPRARREIHTLIRQLSDKGTSVVFASHDMEEVGKLADRIFLIHQGSLIAEGSPDELCRKYQFNTVEELYLAKTEEVPL